MLTLITVKYDDFLICKRNKNSAVNMTNRMERNSFYFLFTILLHNTINSMMKPNFANHCLLVFDGRVNVEPRFSSNENDWKQCWTDHPSLEPNQTVGYFVFSFAAKQTKISSGSVIEEEVPSEGVCSDGLAALDRSRQIFSFN